MLYDPNWDKTETKPFQPEDLSLAGLIAWLETQDPDTTYEFGDIFDCLLCRYARAIGADVSSAGSDSVVLNPNFNRHPVTPEGSHVASGFPCTYGAALKRAKAFPL